MPADFPKGRLDRTISELYPDLSRSFVQKLIETGAVRLDGKPARAATKVGPGDVVSIEIPPPQPTRLVPEYIPLNVIYEDKDVVVLDKPPGLVVHPAPGHPTGTLVHALLARYPDIRIGVTIRPGIVHRLDKDTSGLMVIARTDQALNSLIQQMKERAVAKEYLILVHGRIGVQKGVIEAPIGRHPTQRKLMAVVPQGRPARTNFEVVLDLNGYTLVRARLETGRTHQIRVHFAHIGHPVAGDRVYGPRKVDLPLDRQFLHACRLGFKSPGTGRWLEFESPLPPDLAVVLDYLRGLQHGSDCAEA